eukprot:1170193-Prymnesium_polylepis.1
MCSLQGTAGGSGGRPPAAPKSPRHRQARCGLTQLETSPRVTCVNMCSLICAHRRPPGRCCKAAEGGQGDVDYVVR